MNDRNNILFIDYCFYLLKFNNENICIYIIFVNNY